MRSLVIITLSTTAAALFASPVPAADVEWLPFSGILYGPQCVANDGSAVINGGAGGVDWYRWTEDGVVDLRSLVPDAVPGGSMQFSANNCMTASGDAIFGTVMTTSGVRAVLWETPFATQDDTTVLDPIYARAGQISSDGAWLVGETLIAGSLVPLLNEQPLPTPIEPGDPDHGSGHLAPPTAVSNTGVVTGEAATLFPDPDGNDPYPQYESALWISGQHVVMMPGFGLWGRGGISDDGSVIFGSRFDIVEAIWGDGYPYEFFRYDVASGSVDLPIANDGADQLFLDMTGDGQFALVGCCGSLQVWDQDNGARPFLTYLTDEEGVNLNGLGSSGPFMSRNGRVFMGVATGPSGETELYRICLDGCAESDSDGDGLLDSWETDGIPYTDSNGVAQHYLLDFDGDGMSDAHPMRRDLFVEIDQGPADPDAPDYALNDATLGAVIAAFANAPVSNPDNTTGIDLHLLYDDVLDLPWVWQTGSDSWPEDFDTWRGNWFGTSVERQPSSDREAMLEAKAKGVRYCIGADRLSYHASGVARDAPAADFIVARAAHFEPEGFAATFMHELGHALGLGHGGRVFDGSDDQNWKPNYISVMSYYHMRKFAGTEETWRLDFSSIALPNIHESFLYEAEGIVAEEMLLVPGARTFLTRWPTTDCFPDDLLSVEIEDFPFNTPIDFNRDGMIEPDPDAFVAADLDYHGPGAPEFFNTTPSPCDAMYADLADWDVLVYAVPYADQAGGSAPPNPPVELTVDELAILDTLIPAPCHGDTNGDEMVNTDDLLNVLGVWGGTGYDPADVTFDGVIDVADVLRILGNWGPCD